MEGSTSKPVFFVVAQYAKRNGQISYLNVNRWLSIGIQTSVSQFAARVIAQAFEGEHVMKIGLAVVAGCVMAMSINSASASIINYDFSQLGTVYDNAGQLSAVGGAGYTDVTSAFEANANAAATIWNRATFGITQTLTVAVTLADLTGENAVGDSLITSDNTAPSLPSTSNIRVNDGVGGALIYVSSAPFDNSAFSLVNTTANLNGNVVNVSRFGTAVSGGPADGQYDLLSLFLHEDGHSLGFTDDYGSSYSNLLTASSPAGGCGRIADGTTVGTEGALTVSAVVTGNTSFNIPVLCSDPSHIDGYASNGLYNDATLADPGFGVNQRALITGLDILGLCAADGATAAQCNPNPSFAADTGVTNVPEPGSVWLIASAVSMIGVLTGLRKQSGPTGSGDSLMRKFTESRRSGKRFAAALGATAMLLFGGMRDAKATVMPITIDFSFVADFGTVGPVTGALVFAAAGANIAATDVYVFSAPAGSLNASAMDVDYLPLGSVSANAFTVTTAGAVTAANLFIYSPDGSELLNLNATSNSHGTFIAEEQAGGGFSSVFPGAKFKSVTYTVGAPVVLPIGVPEPASIAGLIVGCLSLTVIRTARRR